MTLRASILLISTATMFYSTFPTPSSAFQDNSTYSSRNRHLRSTCNDGRVVRDTSLRTRSCNKVEVQVDSQGILYKNKIKISPYEVLDFKLSKNGTVYYRLKKDRRLYREHNLLNSGTSGVALYLVSASGNAVYVNEEGQIFKDGILLPAGTGKIIKKRRKPWPVKVSVRGNAVYISDKKDIFIDGKQINRNTSKVLRSVIGLHSDVFFVDTAGRLFRNNAELYSGPDKIQYLDLGPEDEIAYLTNAKRDNLHFKGRRYSAGAERIVGFEFNDSGDLIYEDATGKRWKNGRLEYN